jgi:formylglycine-generating enzyme required for sulfatase activity
MGKSAGQAPDVELKTKVFISYSRKDLTFADQLETALQVREFEALIDREEIYAFEDWWKRIEALVGRADAVVFVISPEAVKSEVALKEIAYAASLNKRLAPIVCRRCEDSSVPEPLRRLNFVFFDDLSQFEASADRLAEGLQTDIGWVRQHTEYGEAERRWVAADRPHGLLLHSPILEVAEYWLGSRPKGAPEPTREIRTFIAASRNGALSAQRVRRLLLASTFTFMAATIVGLIGWINQDYIWTQWHWYRVTRPYASAQIWPHVLSAAQERALRSGDSFRECAQHCPEMVVLPAGSFLMGSPETEKARYDNEGPQHKVGITSRFAVSTFEVTWEQWEACSSIGECPEVWDSRHGRGMKPVINVTWHDAKRYVGWFAKMTGRPYRLLTEAEWEYAARAGTHTAYSWGDEIGKDNANCEGCGSQWVGLGTAPVGSFAANGFGLHDMHGNVWEWVEDCAHQYDSSKPPNCNWRVHRGGAWNGSPRDVRSASRMEGAPDDRGRNVGFRVARTLTPSHE